jgi:hypothetical protein
MEMKTSVNPQKMKLDMNDESKRNTIKLKRIFLVANIEMKNYQPQKHSTAKQTRKMVNPKYGDKTYSKSLFLFFCPGKNCAPTRRYNII